MVKFKAWMNLVRWPNLIILALIPIIIRYGFILPLRFDIRLDTIHFIVFVVGMLTASAAGYIVNDIFDISSDKINKPNKTYVGNLISERSAWLVFFILSALSIVGAWWYSKLLSIEALVWIPMIIIALLWLYSADFKGRPLLGNLIIALLAATHVFMEVIFDILPAINTENSEYQYQAAIIVGALSIFAFWVTLIREIVKDLEDKPGDARAGYHTLAVVWSEKYVKLVALSLSLILLFGVTAMAYFAVGQWIAFSYVSITLVVPTVFSIYKLSKATTTEDYHFISSLFKWIMLFGLIALAVFSFEYLLTIGF